MSKIICDICGTSYPSSAESCPICGFTNGSDVEAFNEDINLDDVLDEFVSEEETAAPTSKKKAIFDFDEVNADQQDDDEDTDDDSDEIDDDDDYDEEDDEKKSGRSVFVIILLTVLIVALLGAAGFIFVRYFLPNMGSEESPETTAAVTEIVAQETEATIPCEYMTMTNAGVAELNAEGQQFLLHVRAIPENTTDKIIYVSGDESIATVTEDGKITAISEGETIVYISCGKYSIECPVIVEFVEDTVPPTTEAVEEETEPEEGDDTQTLPEEDETVPAEGDVDETIPDEGIEEETEPEENAALSDVTLKLKKTDIQLGVYYEFQLVLDCELNQDDVTWTSEHPHIATVDEQGNVTAVKEGTTSITAEYGNQQVQCIVRCVWY